MILTFIFTVSLTLCTVLGYDEQSIEEVKMTIKLMEHDINGIKQKVWIEIPGQLNNLEKELSSRTFVENIQNGNASSAGNCDQSVKSPRDVDKLHDILTKAFEAEKVRAKITERKLEQLESTMEDYLKNVERIDAINLKIRALEDEISKIERLGTNQGHVLKTLQLRLEEVHEQVISLNGWKVNHHDFKENVTKLFEDLSEKLFEVQHSVEQLERMDIKQSYRPSFVSKWYLMKAQDKKLSHLTIEHGLGALPYKVEVQVRPVTGPLSGWVFKGDSAIRGDDDKDIMYGGIVYFYNEERVEMIAPLKNNNEATGVVINTGEENGRRLGNNHDIVNEAYIRVKVWAPRDLPTPDFQSEWLPLDNTDPTKTFREIEHSLDGYPALLSVQIKCESSQSYLVSDGTGAATNHIAWDNSGGVLWSYNDKYVRVWAGHNLNNNYGYTLFGQEDGWFKISDGFETNHGNVRVLAWKRTTFDSGQLESVSEDAVMFPEWQPFQAIDYERDSVSLFVEANEGPNNGFRFPAFGSSQAKTSPFGGVVFAYKLSGEFRLWRPSPDMDGFLVHVPSSYGNAVHSQATNNASFVAVLLTG